MQHALSGRPAGILGIGSFIPPRVMSNADFAQFLDTSDEWIQTRTGIRERHFVEPGTCTSDLGLMAAQRALAVAGKTAADVEAIIVATVTPDTMFPTTANNLQAKLGCRPVMSYDLIGACAGFMYAMESATGLVSSGRHECVLVVGAEVMSSILDFTDRNTCVLFGDGAGAAVIGPVESGGIGDSLLCSDGTKGDILSMPAGGSKMPSSHESVEQRLHYVKMEGKEVFKLAVNHMTNTTLELLGRNGLTPDDLAFVGVHQANRRIVEAVLQRLGIPLERTLMNIDKYGNTTAATLPLVMDEAWRGGQLGTGDRMLLLTFGAGITWGAMLLEWTLARQPRAGVLEPSATLAAP